MAQIWVDIQPGVLNDFTLLGDWVGTPTVIDLGGAYAIEVDETPATENKSLRSLIYDPVGLVSDADTIEIYAEITVRDYTSGNDNNTSIGPVAQQTIVNTSTPDNQLGVSGREDGESVLYDRVSGNFNFSPFGGPISTIDNTYRMRLRIEAGSFLAKAWESGNTEPTSFEASRTRPSLPDGENGISIFRSGRYEITALSFGTDGDSAPTGPVETTGDWSHTEVTTEDGLGVWASAEATTADGIGVWASAEAVTSDGIGTWASTETSTADGLGVWASVETTTEGDAGTWAHTEATTEDGLGTWASVTSITEDGIGVWASVSAETEDGLGIWASVSAETADGLGVWASSIAITEGDVGTWAHTEATTEDGLGAWSHVEDATEDGLGAWVHTEDITEDGLGQWAHTEDSTIDPDADVATGLQHYLPLNQISGSPLDIIQNVHGINRGGIASPDGVRNRALRFDGQSYASLGHQGEKVGGLHAGPDRQWSVRVWAKVEDGETGTVIARASNLFINRRTFQLFFNNTNQPGINLRGNSQSTGLSLRDGQWHQHVITWDGQQALYYADGNTPITLSVGTTGEPSYEPVLLGARRRGTSFRLTGEVDEVGLYDRALSADEVQQLYAGGEALSFPLPEEGFGQWAHSEADTPDVQKGYFFDPNDYEVGDDVSVLPFTKTWNYQNSSDEIFEVRNDDDGKGNYLYLEGIDGQAFFQLDGVPEAQDVEVYARVQEDPPSGSGVIFFPRFTSETNNDPAEGYGMSRRLGRFMLFQDGSGTLLLQNASGIFTNGRLQLEGADPTRGTLHGWQTGQNESQKVTTSENDNTASLQRKGRAGILHRSAVSLKIYAFGVGILKESAPIKKTGIPGYSLVAVARATSNAGYPTEVELYRRGEDTSPVIQTFQGAEGPVLEYDGPLTGGVVSTNLRFYMIDDAQGIVFDTLAGSEDDDFRARVLIDDAEVWRGQLLTDDIQRGTRENGQYTLQLRGKNQTSALEAIASDLEGRHTLAEIVQDSLQPLSQLPVATATAWTLLSDPIITEDVMWVVQRDVQALTGREDKPLSLDAIAEDTAKLMQARVMQWGGEWVVYQPTYLSSSTEWQTSQLTRTEDNTLSFSDVEVELGGIERARPAIRQQSVRYAHGERGDVILQNNDFSSPIQGSDGDGEGNWTQSAVGVSQPLGSGPVRINTIVDDNTLPNTPPARYIRQRPGSVVGGPDRKVLFGFASRLFSGETTRTTVTHRLFYRIRVGDYYWNHKDKVWQQSVFNNPRDFSVITDDIPSPAVLTDVLVDGNGDPISGTVEITIYSGWSLVDDATDVDPWFLEVEGVDFEISVVGEDGEETLARTVTAGVQGKTAGAVPDEVQVLSGDGPTSIHPARLTLPDGDNTGDWKVGTYASGEAGTGTALQELWAQQALQQRRPAQQLYEETWHLPDEVPLSPLYVMDRAGIRTHWERLTLDFRRHTMSGLWVQMHPVDEDLPVAFVQEDVSAETGVVEKRTAGIVSFPALSSLDERAGVYIKGPMDIDQRLWALPIQKDMQATFPFADGQALDHDGQSRTIAVQLNGSTVGTIDISSSGTVSSDISNGTPFPAGSLVTLVGPDSTFSGDITLALNFRVGL